MHADVAVVLDRPLEVAPDLGTRLDYTTVASVVETVHARLAHARIGAGDRVAIVRRNSFDTVILACAVARLGAIPALISPRVPAAAVGELLGRLGQPTVISDQQTLASLELAPDDERIAQLLTIGPSERTADLLEIAAGTPPPPCRRAPGEPLCITHTSGTTGPPKLVLHSSRSLMAQVKPQLLLGAPFARDGDRAAACLSWSHTRALVAWAGIAMRGLPYLALGEFTPDAVAAHLAAFEPTIVETHPNAYIGWETLADHPARPLANVKVYFSTFDSVHPRTIRRLLAASRRRVAFWLQVYGQSEVGPATMRIYPKGVPLAANAGRGVGWPLPGFTRVRVVNPRTGRRARHGTPGMIQVASQGRALTYFGQAELAAEQRDGRWWSMGDIGTIGRSRTLSFLDRTVDAIPGIDSGIALEDILLERLPQAREVVIVPTAAAKPVAVVCTNDDIPLDPDAWREAVKGLPPLDGPVHLRWEELPMTGTLKVRRLELRERLAADTAVL